MNEVLPEHLFHICTIPGPARSHRFPTFQFGQIKPMGKLNASVGENILFHSILRDENASALSGVFVSVSFSINELVVENFHLNPLHSRTLRKSQPKRSGRHLLTRAH